MKYFCQQGVCCYAGRRIYSQLHIAISPYPADGILSAFVVIFIISFSISSGSGLDVIKYQHSSKPSTLHAIIMRLRLTSILLILTVSCKTKTSDWQTLDFGSFKLKTPSGWTEIERKGIDSYVGGLTNGKDTLSFDYGWYSPDIGDEDPKKHRFGQDTINGLIARLAIPIKPGDGFIRMYIPVNRDDKFSISGHNIQSTDTILKIFKSIVFKESDTTINGALTLSKFKVYPHGTGKTLVMQKCASCHAMNKIIEGPALKDLMQDRTSDWLFKFFTKRESVAYDSMHIKLKEVFNNRECMRFPDITIEEVELIREYIMNK